MVRWRDVRLWTVDLDDTLVDTEAAMPARLAAAVNQAQLLTAALKVSEMPAVVAEMLAVDPIAVGRLPALLARFGIAPGSYAAESVAAAYYAGVEAGLRLFPGVVETLARLRLHAPVAIVTNGGIALQQRKVAAVSLLSHVDRVVISEAVGMRKPDPGIFLHVCRQFAVDPSYAVHVGDSLVTDVAGAQRAGMRAIWVRRGAAASGVAADAVIHRFSDLAALLDDEV